MRVGYSRNIEREDSFEMKPQTHLRVSLKTHTRFQTFPSLYSHENIATKKRCRSHEVIPLLKKFDIINVNCFYHGSNHYRQMFSDPPTGKLK